MPQGFQEPPDPEDTTSESRVQALGFGLVSLLSFGPRKLWPGSDPRFFATDPWSWPAILVGTPLILLLLSRTLRLRRAAACVG